MTLWDTLTSSDPHGNSLSTEHLAVSLVGIELHLGLGEVGDVVGVEHLAVEFSWVSLRQEERLRGLSIVADGCEEQLGIDPVFPFRGENGPLAV